MLVNRIIPLSEEILHSKPHISICYFEASDFSDDYILTKAKQVFSSIQSFTVQVEGSEFWKNGTLVLKVTPDDNTLKLQKQLSTEFKGVIKNLHLTIARNLSSELLDKTSMEPFDYQGEFTCNSIHILKKKGRESYQLIETIYLKETEQNLNPAISFY